MPSSNQILGFFDNQCFWKERIDISDFSHGDIYQGQVASEATTFGWVYPGLPSHTQFSLDLLNQCLK